MSDLSGSSPYRTPGEVEKEEPMSGPKRDWGEVFNGVFTVTLGVSLALGLVALVAVPLFKTVAADGKADFCYLEPETFCLKSPEEKDSLSCTGRTNGYTIKQHVPWRSDRTLLRQVPNAEDARKEADRFGCLIR